MDAEQVGRIRSFNRAVARRIGALTDSFLDRGRPLGEARLLYEIGRDGATLRELRTRLSLDSGYLSRLLQSLKSQGLVESGPADDRRMTRARLTRKGLAEVWELDRRSDAFAASFLAPLSEAQQTRLVAAMAEVERLLQASAVEIASVLPQSAEASWCLQEYFRELEARFDGGFDAKQSNSPDPAEFAPPGGVFMIARLDGQPVGCGAMRLMRDRGIGEIKRMWVAPSARGLGIGRRMLEALEAQAREAGLRVFRLETNRALSEARALYRGSGYRETAPFNDEAYAHHWFEKVETDPSKGVDR
jgi:DNA-binding MarR family transcriptional regulator/predicted GNAT family acetyltransferase